MQNEIVIDCPRCAVRVKTVSVIWVDGDHAENEEVANAFFVVKCPSCRGALFGSVASQYDRPSGELEWLPTELLWPPFVEVGPSVPEAARQDIQDAQRSLDAGVYSAVAVLCGRALERLIKEKVGGHMIGKGLAELKAKGFIDQRVFDWAEALRKERNIGAHASDKNTTKEDAKDIIDFTVASLTMSTR